MKTYLDFGAGWKAIHTLALREQGLEVTAHDYGRNFDPNLHDRCALDRQYDVVFASNVINAHCTLHALRGTVAQIALATKPDGLALVNYPKTPRKMPQISAAHMEEFLGQFFLKIQRLPGPTPVWRLARPHRDKAAAILEGFEFTNLEIATSNIRPAGAIGANAVVPRLVLELHQTRSALDAPVSNPHDALVLDQSRRDQRN